MHVNFEETPISAASIAQVMRVYLWMCVCVYVCVCAFVKERKKVCESVCD